MTVKELYEWCKENNCENYDIGIVSEYDRVTIETDVEMIDREYSVEDEKKVVWL